MYTLLRLATDRPERKQVDGSSAPSPRRRHRRWLWVVNLIRNTGGVRVCVLVHNLEHRIGAVLRVLLQAGFRCAAERT